jgi:hypothetical protein
MVLDRNRTRQLKCMKVAKKKGLKLALSATGAVPTPGDFPIGSPASRAAARVKLERLPTAPPFVVHFAGCSGETLACDEARLDNERVPRLPGESQEDFEKRLLSMAPRGRPALILMVPSASEVERDEMFLQSRLSGT